MISMLGYIYALLSAVSISVFSIAAKQALKKEHSLDFAIFSHILGLVLILPFLFFAKFNISLNYLLLIYLSSLIGAFGFWFRMRAIRHIDISVEAPMFNLSIVFTAILGFIFLGEKLSWVDIAGIGIVFFGIYLLETTNGLKGLIQEFKKSKYLSLLIIGALIYSFGTIVDRDILKEVNVFTFLLLAYSFLSINYIIMFILFHRHEVSFAIIFKEARESGFWLTLFSVSKLTADFFFASALSMLYAGVAVAIQRFSAVLTVILAGQMLKEKNIARKIIAAIIIFSGILLLIFK